MEVLEHFAKKIYTRRLGIVEKSILILSVFLDQNVLIPPGQNVSILFLNDICIYWKLLEQFDIERPDIVQKSLWILGSKYTNTWYTSDISTVDPNVSSRPKYIKLYRITGWKKITISLQL